MCDARRDFFYKMVPTAESELASSGGRIHVHPKAGELEMEAVGVCVCVCVCVCIMCGRTCSMK